MGMVLLAPGLPGQPTKRITLGAPYVSGRESLWVSADSLGIPDDFEYMDPELVSILREKVPTLLGAAP